MVTKSIELMQHAVTLMAVLNYSRAASDQWKYGTYNNTYAIYIVHVLFMLIDD